jgi:hypothetical protein
LPDVSEIIIPVQAKAVNADARLKRVFKLKLRAMKNYNRDLLVLYKSNVFSEDLLEKELECLHRILIQVERMDAFTAAHELVTRTRITGRAKAILRAIGDAGLRPFHFLINKN